MSVQVLIGDCREVLAGLPAESVQCCVSSPPYFNLRCYGHEKQIGLEQRPDCLGWATGSPCGTCYVCTMVAVFREVRRVLRPDGTLWLNLGDSYCSTDKWGGGKGGNRGKHVAADDGSVPSWACRSKKPHYPGLKPKDLMLIPARVALALQADGWWLRSEIIWAKAATMPESVRDRPTCAHEKVWLLAKSPTYFYDAAAIAEPSASLDPGNSSYRPNSVRIAQEGRKTFSAKNSESMRSYPTLRNARNVWTLNPEPSGLAHFATMPPTLAERCIKAGSRPGDMVLDPFGGAGTTGLVADRLGRHATLIELNPEYADMARRRIAGDAPLFAEVA